MNRINHHLLLALLTGTALAAAPLHAQTTPDQTAVGTGAAATGAEATAVGTLSSAATDSSAAIGAEANASGFAAQALGTGALAQGDVSTAVGLDSWTVAKGSIAIGAISYTTGDGGISIGQLSESQGNDAIAIGGNSAYDLLAATGSSPTTGTLGAYAVGVGATTLGGQARVGQLNDSDPFDLSAGTPADYGTAIGFGAVVDANATRGTAIGANAHAAQAGATAIGAGAVTTAANQVALGGAGSSVRIGDVAASTAAQSGTTAVMTVDASGTVGRDTTIRPAIGALQSGQTALQSAQTVMQGQISSLFDLAKVNSREIGKANEGVAMALAMETPVLPAGTHFGVAGGFGYYNNRVAGTASIAVRVGEQAAVSAGIGVGMNTGEVGARTGFQAAW